MRLSPSRLLDQALAPAPDRKRIAGLADRAFAHRGLHGGPRVENSRAAFLAAIEQGYGIELDVQASLDGDAFVFHDAQLERLTGEPGLVAKRSSSQLQSVYLRGTDEAIPTLPEVLSLIGGRVPLLIEVKAPDRKVAPLCLSVLRALEGYKGRVGVMSFNPDIAHWFGRYAPRVTRGLVVSEHGKRSLRGRFERRLALWRARPDFLAYDIRSLPSRFAARARKRGLPVYTWTVRTDADRQRAAAHAEQIIFEGAV